VAKFGQKSTEELPTTELAHLEISSSPEKSVTNYQPRRITSPKRKISQGKVKSRPFVAVLSLEVRFVST